MEKVIVDDFLKKPINAAHFHNRRAQLLEEFGDKTAAIEHHNDAIRFLELANLKSDAFDTQADLSLRLQISYHESRMKLLKAQIENKINQEPAEHEIKRNNDSIANKCDGFENNSQDNTSNFEIMKRQIETGKLSELQVLGFYLLDLVKVQQDQILHLSQELQKMMHENEILKKSCKK